ncbi:MAG: cob(I)yrinic acid a,c-diamide adenosyltransferase [Bacteroidales bacterium]|jgi:cob(I)alamin adenosyltransferase|nr:cob(I)yrinic acid a,c-diamide adenosyltransferase [Bacteroidales bacterium]
MKIYTRTGDDGTTSLSGGRRVPKFHPRIEAYGSVDELISWIGLLRGCPVNNSRKAILLYIQDQLMICAAALAADPKDGRAPVKSPDNKCTARLEKEIDKMEERLTPLRNFVLPGGNPDVSYCHIARCVCRRTERAVLKLNETEKTPEIIIKFLNRLSDYLFVLSRKLSSDLDNEEIKWPV